LKFLQRKAPKNEGKANMEGEQPPFIKKSEAKPSTKEDYTQEVTQQKPDNN
jgi:hypothetical protein